MTPYVDIWPLDLTRHENGTSTLPYFTYYTFLLKTCNHNQNISVNKIMYT